MVFKPFTIMFSLLLKYFIYEVLLKYDIFIIYFVLAQATKSSSILTIEVKKAEVRNFNIMYTLKIYISSIHIYKHPH